MRGRPLQDMAIGDSAELTRVATPGDVAEFIDSIGDHNPIHQDYEYAAATRFEKPIVPGMWTAGLISAVLGTKLPGPGCIYVSQQIAFTRPVYFGDRITARVEVVERVADRNRVRLKTVCTDREGQEVLVGEALLSPPKQAVAYTRRETGPTRVAHWTLQPTLWAAHATGAWARLGTAWVSAWHGNSDRPWGNGTERSEPGRRRPVPLPAQATPGSPRRSKAQTRRSP